MKLRCLILTGLFAPAICLAQEKETAATTVVVSRGKDPASRMLNRWFAEGKAAGLHGVYYDNRDRKHSDLGIASYPQLQPITYTEEEKERKADWGSQLKVFPDKVVIGNSSTASPANRAGSHQRMYYLHPQGLEFLYKQYRTNALYIYPEHRDHDPGTNGPDGYGDLYPAISPYLISSQGSSGSDKAFMHAFLKTIGAFPPETQETLIANGLLMPTLQAIFRRTYKAVEKPDDYFTGKAHPSAFDGKLIDEVAMVKQAQAMLPEAIPPLAQFVVIDESPAARPGVDFFEPARVSGETIADSSCAVSRVFRGPAYRRTIRLSAQNSSDLHQRELRFRWVILRGDPKRIRIETSGENAVDATITVAYHPRRPIAPGSPMWSSRVDIGLFAIAAGEHGDLVSAPAFFSFTSLPNEHRTYSDDGQGRPIEIFYAARTSSAGLPPIDHPHWDRLLAHFEKTDAELAPGVRLLTAFMEGDQIAALRHSADATATARSEIATARKQLDAITERLQKAIDQANDVRVKAAAAHKKQASAETKAALDAANRKHNAAKQALREGDDGAAALRKSLADLRAAVVTTLREHGVVAIVRSTLLAMRDDPLLFSSHEARIRAIAKEGSTAALTAALRRLADIGVTLPDAETVADRRPANELYHLRQFNLDLLSDLILSDFLIRPPRLNYADPRLTAAKQWRDVFRTNDDGSIAGWTRFQDGEHSDYTAEGQLIEGDKAKPVRYLLDPQSKRLEISLPE